MLDQFTICVLLYGDHIDLAKKCLLPLVTDRLFSGHQLRIGCNAVSDSTKQFLDELKLDCLYYKSDANRKKYPVMRDMFHGHTPIQTPYTMWFDDDSYITQPLASWINNVAAAMHGADMIGSRYTTFWKGHQKAYVRRQSWYTGNDPSYRSRMKFITGGWWTIRTPLLYKYNYPWPDLNHCGGDSMLGELCVQQSLVTKQFNTGVCINADDAGVESARPRRGYTERPLGADGK